MTDDWKKTVHRNKLLGLWAAEKLGITGQDAEVRNAAGPKSIMTRASGSGFVLDRADDRREYRSASATCDQL
jgi:hypothetical protein